MQLSQYGALHKRFISNAFFSATSAYLCALCVENTVKRRERRGTQRAAETDFEQFVLTRPPGIFRRIFGRKDV